MPDKTPYFPQPIFGGNENSPLKVPRVLIAPGRYIQGPGVLDHLGRYLSVLHSARPAILISRGGQKRFGERLQQSLSKGGADAVVHIFEGECSYEAVSRIVDSLRTKTPAEDAIIAVGGGKCLDTGKSVAFRLDVPVVICPTIASTDAPCSAVSVMYSEEGVQVGPEFFPHSPALVVVDTQIIVNAPIRQLVSGMGDGLATYYEARTCFNNPKARSMVGGRPTITVLAIAELCARTIMEKGPDAVASVSRKEISEAVEQIVEANTLLSGVGFESGGLAAAHCHCLGAHRDPRSAQRLSARRTGGHRTAGPIASGRQPGRSPPHCGVFGQSWAAGPCRSTVPGHGRGRRADQSGHGRCQGMRSGRCRTI